MWVTNQPEDDFGGSGLTIVETAGMQRGVRLQGRAGPFKGVEFGGSMRAEITHYAGNPIASIQVLGAEEAPTTFKGKWKRRYFAANEFITDPMEAEFIVVDAQGMRTLVQVPDMVAYVDSIRRAGQLLEVNWAEILRVGILKKFTPTFMSRMEVEWEMEFEWISQGEVHVETRPRTNSLSDVEQLMAKSVGDIVAAVDQQPAPERFENSTVTVPTDPEGPVYPDGPSDAAAIANSIAPVGASVGQAVASFLRDGEVQARVNRLVAQYAGIRDAAASVVDGIGGVGTATRTTIAVLFGIRADAVFLREYALRTTTEALFGVTDAALVGVADLLTASAVTRRFGAGVLQTRNDANQVRSDLEREVEPELFAIITAREGQNLRDVSFQYYGTTDGWRFLKQYNRTDSSELTAGQVIFVPRRLGRVEEGVDF